MIAEEGTDDEAQAGRQPMTGDPRDVSVLQLAEAIERGDAPLVVDTRSRLEYAAEHIPGAVNLPFWRAAVRHSDLNAEPDTPMVLYCGHGPRALWAKRVLEGLGYRQVGLLHGHFRGWKRR